ncbi:hypothetical protein PNOK_0463300 [Pyrrhoderma noxium]|uniref:Uncharacterized protein n=1 Tax=Pyrrhoderma noxium TaxID=2282107 RepID=A0A286UJK9_9AGAM|nr:hypothetical protein PNOK_0463300 [Pyrrhoderma noxium]
MAPRRRRLLINPSTLIMPDFTTNGYAPSRACKRRQFNCNNTRAIEILQNDWLEKQRNQQQRWDEENPQQQTQRPPPGTPEHHLSLQNLSRQNTATPETPEPHVSHDQVQNIVQQLQNSVPATHAPSPTLPHEILPMAISSENLQPHVEHLSEPQANASSNNNHSSSQEAQPPFSWENQLVQLVHRLQQDSQAPDGNPNLNTDASSASSSNLNKIKLGRPVHDVMQDFHLLPLPVLEELRHMRHVKLWFFTNDGLEKTRLAKEKTGRYNTASVHFDFEKQGLVTENEYEATMKSAPEDNTLSPDQLN